MKIILKYKKTGILIDENHNLDGTPYYRLVIGLDGKVYDVSDWAYDGSGGAYFKDVGGEFEVCFIVE